MNCRYASICSHTFFTHSIYFILVCREHITASSSHETANLGRSKNIQYGPEISGFKSTKLESETAIKSAKALPATSQNCYDAFLEGFWLGVSTRRRKRAQNKTCIGTYSTYIFTNFGLNAFRFRYLKTKREGSRSNIARPTNSIRFPMPYPCKTPASLSAPATFGASRFYVRKTA